MEQTKKECLLQFTDKIKFRSTVKEKIVGDCAGSKLPTKDSAYATHVSVKAFRQNLISIAQKCSN